ncbi:sulfotransferase [Alteromonas sp. ASW11-19]|uniref:Sulfotransferase n=1 Tax=Alteromonas salexigens TaxID=2982530 RepID=A0ABT2VM58_9ALTE|nr:tetratricopeptide repeat-containing sulfotransferase family protein [Alteromonas salexigens]MCU7554405.1 sulfotransferase [Alteromonas salexigens]
MQNTHQDINAILKSARQAVQQGQFASAIDTINNALPGTHEDAASSNEPKQDTHVSEQANDLQQDTHLNVKAKVELLYLRAVALRLSQHFTQAIEDTHTILSLRPDHGRAFQEQAYSYKALNQHRQAASAFYQATRFNPALLASWQQLLAIYQQQNNARAESLAQQHISFLTSLPKPVLGAYDLMYDGQLAAADSVCRRYLQQHNHDAEAMVLLAEIGMKLKAYHEAEFLLESCVALHPEHERAAVSYQGLLARLGKYPQAKTFAEKRLQNQPDNFTLQVAYANALVGVGELAQAIDIYRSLLESNNDRPAVWLSLGHAYKAEGDRKAAIECYETAAQLMPEFGDAYWSLANTKTYPFSDAMLETMAEQAARDDVGLEDTIHLCFALGKAYEDRQDYPAAFEHYHRGNTLKRATIDFDIARTEAAMAAQQEACQKDLFARKAGCDDPAPIFVVGLPRAGSTLLEQILASHSQVDGTMELHDILTIASRLSGQQTPYPFNLASLTDDQCRRLGELYIEQTQAYRQGAPFFIDKMPNNFIHIGLIKRILPNAKIIDARREPFACCFSGYKQLFGDGQEFSYSLSDIGRYYRAYENLMDHWHTVLPGEVLTVQHESVLDDLEGQVKRMLDFCGLPFEAECLSFHETKRVIKTPSSEQVRQPINRSGTKQWLPFTEYLTTLFTALDQFPESSR